MRARWVWQTDLGRWHTSGFGPHCDLGENWTWAMSEVGMWTWVNQGTTKRPDLETVLKREKKDVQITTK